METTATVWYNDYTNGDLAEAVRVHGRWYWTYSDSAYWVLHRGQAFTRWRMKRKLQRINDGYDDYTKDP